MAESVGKHVTLFRREEESSGPSGGQTLATKCGRGSWVRCCRLRDYMLKEQPGRPAENVPMSRS